MSLYDGVDIDGVPMQSNSTEGTDITKLCEFIYNSINIFSVFLLCLLEWISAFLTFFQRKVVLKIRALNSMHFILAYDWSPKIKSNNLNLNLSLPLNL